ncbi:MAG: hypothetical protein QS748_13020 [Candidatus Endonucleobacter bathymodioli]|uniref:Uncharacterized protein n=1 Tax=Candidatus Endonucleibacter bathymodioli TaxID=539814 RepID=A0AA90NMT1_9GAMM|nr:hypothetical protein [Candidatus Endonucleobacter bathymodioli]
MPNKLSMGIITPTLSSIDIGNVKCKTDNILKNTTKKLIRKLRDTSSDKPLSKRAVTIPVKEPIIYTRSKLDKPLTLNQIYQEQGSKGVSKHLTAKLKDLQPVEQLLVEIKNPEETFEAQSIKKHLNNRLEKEINKIISSITKETQLEKSSKTSESNSPFSRHKLFQPLVNLRNELQKKHELDVFTDQISNIVQKELLDMSGELRGQLVKGTIYGDNITTADEEDLNEHANNNYERNYSDFPENLPTKSCDLAKTIIDLNLHQIHEEIRPKETHITNLKKTNAKKLSSKEKGKVRGKEIRRLEKRIMKLEKRGVLSTLNLEEKYQKLKTENFHKILETTKTELETQAYVGKLTLDVVRGSLGEENAKSQIDDKWDVIKAELDAEIEIIRTVVIDNIHDVQDFKMMQVSNNEVVCDGVINNDNTIDNNLAVDTSPIYDTIDDDLVMHTSAIYDDIDNNARVDASVIYDNVAKNSEVSMPRIFGLGNNKIINIFNKVVAIINTDIINHMRLGQTEPRRLTITTMPSLDIYINENKDGSLNIKYDAQNVKSKVLVLEFRGALDKLINEKWKEARRY